MTSIPAWRVAGHRERAISADSVLRLFAAEGWWPDRTEDAMDQVIRSGSAVGAWVGDELVGFARAVDDGELRAYIEDVVVAQPERRAGVASALITQLMAVLPPRATISLFCSPRLEPFYAQLEFTATKQVVMHRPPA